MRILLAILLLLNVGASAGVATGTLYKSTFNSTVVDLSENGYDAAWAGTATYTNATCPDGDKSAGVFTDGNYIDHAAGLDTDMSSESVLFFEFYLKLNNLANNPVPLYFSPSTGVNAWFQPLSDGSAKFQWAADSTTLAVGPGTIATGNCYYIGLEIHSGSANSKLWVTTGTPDYASPTDTGNFNKTIATVVNVTTGRYLPAGGFAVSGYISEFRVMNVAPDALPVDDGDEGLIRIGPSLEMDREVSLERFLGLFTSPLETSVLRHKSHREIIADADTRKNERVARKIESQIKRGEITRTPTPVKSKPTFTPTPTPGTTKTPRER